MDPQDDHSLQISGSGRGSSASGQKASIIYGKYDITVLRSLENGDHPEGEDGELRE
jgi:hypothetical protein